MGNRRLIRHFIAGGVGICLLFFFCACKTVSTPAPSPTQTVKLLIEGVDAVKVEAETEEDKIHKSMEVHSSELEFSGNCRTYGNKAFLQITSVASYEANCLWSDLKLIRMKGIKEIVIYMNNPGGSAFDGMGMYDQLRLLKNEGVHITAEAYGLIASAAVPVYLVANKRIASRNTTFLIHPSKLWKFGMFEEGLRDLESQSTMLKLCRERYAEAIEENSTLSKKQIIKMMSEDTWFTAEQAKKWGFIDELR